MRPCFSRVLPSRPVKRGRRVFGVIDGQGERGEPTFFLSRRESEPGQDPSGQTIHGQAFRAHNVYICFLCICTSNTGSLDAFFQPHIIRVQGGFLPLDLLPYVGCIRGEINIKRKEDDLYMGVSRTLEPV